MRIGSLFSGAGGLDMAVEAMFGATTAWHCEIDPAASKVLAARWPGVPNLGDITAVNWESIEPVDILCGGFPCQDVSSAGRRAGIREGTRSGLWAIYADAIAALRPRIVVVENVRGLLNARAHRAMESANPVVGDAPDGPVLRAAGAVLGDLADLGYDAQWATVAASDMGAPHRRERVFIVAHAEGSGAAGITWVDGGEQAVVGTIARTGGGDRAGNPAARVQQLGRSAGQRSAGAHAHSSRDGRHEGRPEPARLERGSDAAVSGAGFVELLPTPRSSDCFGAGKHGDGGMDLRTTVVETASQWGKYEPAIRRWEQLTRPAPPPTEPNTKGNPRLAAAFSEWMIGWPEGWVTHVPGISRNDALRIIGNGVCPQQAHAALQWLLSVCEVAA